MDRIIILTILHLLISGCDTTVKAQPPTPEEMAKGAQKTEEIQHSIHAAFRIVNNYEEGLRRAKEENKPIALIFTGYAVINSRKLEHEVLFENKAIFSILQKDYINVWLYIDERRSDLSEVDQQAGFKTWGQKWSRLQFSRFKGNSQPQIFILNSNGETLGGGIGYHDAKTQLLSLLKKYRPD